MEIEVRTKLISSYLRSRAGILTWPRFVDSVIDALETAHLTWHFSDPDLPAGMMGIEPSRTRNACNHLLDALAEHVCDDAWGWIADNPMLILRSETRDIATSLENGWKYAYVQHRDPSFVEAGLESEATQVGSNYSVSRFEMRTPALGHPAHDMRFRARGGADPRNVEGSHITATAIYRFHVRRVAELFLC